jgi:hypothetical protein
MRKRSRARALRLAATALLLCAAACRPRGAASPDAPLSGTPVARVGDDTILLEELRLPAGARDTEARRRAVELAVNDRLFAAEARRRGLDREGELQRRVQAIRRDAAARERSLLREALVREVAGETRISEAELKESFEKNRALYQRRLYTLRHAAFPSREAAEQAARALDAGGSLEQARFESIGPVLLHELPRMFQRQVAAVRKPGQALVVPGDGNWLAVEVVDVQLAPAESYEDVRRQLFASLRQERNREIVEKLMAELKQNATVQLEEAVLADDSLWQEERRAAEP